MTACPHTDWPWQALNEHEPYTIIGGIDGPDEGRFHYTEVCTVNADAPDADANAKLIIAAPELLRSLRNLADAVGAMRVPQNFAEAGLQVSVTLGPALKAARATLAKAGG